MFYETRLVTTLRHEVDRLTREMEQERAAREEAERVAWWYRSQLVAEARLGLALARIGA